MLALEQFKSRLPFFILRYIKEEREKGVIEAAGLADARHLLVQSINGGDTRKLVRTFSDVQNKPNKPRTIQNQGVDSNFFKYCKKLGHVIQNCKNLNCKVSKKLVDKSRLIVKPVLSVNASADPDVFRPYKREGNVSLPGTNTKCLVTILRDTGKAMSMIQLEYVPNIETAFTGENIVAAALGPRVPCPLAKVFAESPIYIGFLKVIVIDRSLEVPNDQLLLGNEAKDSEVILLSLAVDEPIKSSKTDDPEVFPVCAVTRSSSK